MAKINFVVPPLDVNKFSGGIWCIMQYADGLAKKGHDVEIYPMLPSDEPKWYKGSAKIIVSKKSTRVSEALKIMPYLINCVLKRDKNKIKSSIQAFVEKLSLIEHKILPYELKKALTLNYLRNNLRNADVTMATSFETALPVLLYGRGKKFYFIQHFEPYFKNETENPLLAEKEALLSYNLGLNIIANSPWLKSKVEEYNSNSKIDLCENAINHEIFYGSPKIADENKIVKIISYGGRNAEWKGFKEMAEAVKISRHHLSEYTIEWYVYGDALLPPNNEIASYKSLGFLKPEQLAEAYKQSDILLSASWYESFPLFPIEAMACGLPVITTQYGTESYAIHEETAQIVEARNPENIANGLIKLIKDVQYRNTIAKNGNSISKLFTWDRSINKMNDLILEK
ncbi:glycosyltransferase family 4 protein [Paenibacillus hamazuiensis]|uniref:glycosyltransferase family 4 protein n=1 Tax=Paenibacillus hamazuiensis TaxID=2936508 RepID=UPI00200E3C15|nr:glycosyltransferase family 4 protein [Paenibacillus hamazuiensis]